MGIRIRWKFDNDDNSIILLYKENKNYTMRKICLNNRTLSDCGPVQMCGLCGITTPGKMLDKLNSQLAYTSCHKRTVCTGCKKQGLLDRLYTMTFMEYILKKISCPEDIIKLCLKIFPDEKNMYINTDDIRTIIKHLLTSNDVPKPILEDIYNQLPAGRVNIYFSKMNHKPVTDFFASNKSIDDYTRSELEEKDTNVLDAGIIVTNIISKILAAEFSCLPIITSLFKCTFLTEYEKLPAYRMFYNDRINPTKLLHYMSKVIKIHRNLDHADDAPTYFP